MNPVQARFAREYGMPPEKVERLARAARKAAKWNEHYLNGDPHDESDDKTDKNHNSELWGRDVDTLTEVIADLVRSYGFTAVVYTGLGPTLKRGEQFVEIPY